MQTRQTVQLDTIAQIALTVSDLERAKHFYRDLLGINFLFDAGSMAFFQVGAIRLMLGLAETAVSLSSTILYFKVADIEAAHASLVEQGVTFLQPPHLVAKMPDHDLWLTLLKDPDENILGLLCELPRP